MTTIQYKGITFGIPKEIMHGERRVSAIPDTVKKLVDGGAEVLVEKGAGEGAFIEDQGFLKVGAVILDDVEDIYSKADVILKVKEPMFNKIKGKYEVDMMHEGQILVTFLHPAAPPNHGMIKNLAKKGVTSLTLDGIPRISRAQSMDALTSMSTVAGYKSVIMAADRLSKFIPMVGTAVGMIKPATVFVIGTGVAGLQAVATAKRLGAVVYAADIRGVAVEHAKSLGSKIIDISVPDEVAVGQGGYAKHLPEEWLLKEREEIKDIVKESDIVISSALVPGRLAPILITDDMVKTMKSGSVIVDISIDQGGNCELTKGGEIITQYGISIDGTKNIPGMVPTSSTWMFANNIYNYVSYFIKDGTINVNADTKDEIIASSLVTIDKQIVHAGAKEAMKIA